MIAERWGILLQVRDRVLKSLEEARAAKQIGNALEACVVLQAPGKLYNLLQEFEQELADLFIVSQVTLVKKEGGS